MTLKVRRGILISGWHKAFSNFGILAGSTGTRRRGEIILLIHSDLSTNLEMSKRRNRDAVALPDNPVDCIDLFGI